MKVELEGHLGLFQCFSIYPSIFLPSWTELWCIPVGVEVFAGSNAPAARNCLHSLGFNFKNSHSVFFFFKYSTYLTVFQSSYKIYTQKKRQKQNKTKKLDDLIT